MGIKGTVHLHDFLYSVEHKRFFEIFLKVNGIQCSLKLQSVTLYFKMSLLQCYYTFKYWVILIINYMYSYG